jgi:hypothetical protein
LTVSPLSEQERSVGYVVEGSTLKLTGNPDEALGSSRAEPPTMPEAGAVKVIV